MMIEFDVLKERVAEYNKSHATQPLFLHEIVGPDNIYLDADIRKIEADNYQDVSQSSSA